MKTRVDTDERRKIKTVLWLRFIECFLLLPTERSKSEYRKLVLCRAFQLIRNIFAFITLEN